MNFSAAGLGCRVCLIAMLALLPALAPATEPLPVEVMIVGDFHMANPGKDLHNVKVDDVLVPKRQAEIENVVTALARFKPTKVAAERSADAVAQSYPQYLAGSLAPSRSEVEQLGFRLAKAAGLNAAYGIDVKGDFPYEAVEAYANAHGQSAALDKTSAETEARIKVEERILAENGVAAVLRYLNDPERLAGANGFYRTTLRIGGGKDQPGADLMTAWYKRNFLICANLIQLLTPGDRIVVFYGAGHAFLLRQCVRETPGFSLVEPNLYLPK